MYTEERHYTVFLIACVRNRGKMYRTSAILKIYAAVHFVQETECILYTLLKKGRVAITDKICPLEKIHFFYVKRSRRVFESEF